MVLLGMLPLIVDVILLEMCSMETTQAGRLVTESFLMPSCSSDASLACSSDGKLAKGGNGHILSVSWFRYPCEYRCHSTPLCAVVEFPKRRLAQPAWVMRSPGTLATGTVVIFRAWW